MRSLLTSLALCASMTGGAEAACQKLSTLAGTWYIEAAGLTSHTCKIVVRSNGTASPSPTSICHDANGDRPVMFFWKVNQSNCMVQGSISIQLAGGGWLGGPFSGRVQTKMFIGQLQVGDNDYTRIMTGFR